MYTPRTAASLIAAAAAVTALSTASAAEPINIKPGLWEMTTTMTMTGAPLTMKSTLTSPNGKTVMEMKTVAKWLGASCPAEESDKDD